MTERRSRRFLGVLAGVLALAVLATTLLSVFANQQRTQALQAYSLSVAANAEQALADLDSGTALSLALAANRIADPPRQAQRAPLDAAYAPGARSLLLLKSSDSRLHRVSNQPGHQSAGRPCSAWPGRWTAGALEFWK